jgi:hypothetical protein
MKGIKYKNDGEIIELVNDIDLYHFDKNANRNEPDLIFNNSLFIEFTESFGYTFNELNNSELLIDKINEYRFIYPGVKQIIMIFNEVIVNPDVIDSFEKEIDLPCIYATYDMMPSDDDRKLFLPLSMYSQIGQLIDADFMNGKKFLQNMNHAYYELRKPHKLIFYSNHINPTRIDIFNILKATDNLKNNIWSFSVSMVYYSAEKHNLSKFLKDNENLIPHSYDSYSEKTIVLKHTYFSQFLAYFEIVTESYFFKDIKDVDKHCPVTEKIVKPIAGCLPFIHFGSGNLKKCLEEIGMTFESPLYGFYDCNSEDSVNLGLAHVTLQSIKSIDELHEIYFKYADEYRKNCDIFFDYYTNHRNYILDVFNGKNEKIFEKWKSKKLI